MIVFSPCAEMFLRSALVTIFSLPALISGSLIPAVGRDVGGVPSSDNASNLTHRNLARSGPGNPSARTPGKLRGVVENSGICGEVFSFNAHPLPYSQFWQRNLVSIRLLVMVT